MEFILYQFTQTPLYINNGDNVTDGLINLFRILLYYINLCLYLLSLVVTIYDIILTLLLSI